MNAEGFDCRRSTYLPTYLPTLSQTLLRTSLFNNPLQINSALMVVRTYRIEFVIFAES